MRKLTRLLNLALVAGLALSACGQATPTSQPAEATPVVEPTQAEPTAIGPGTGPTDVPQPTAEPPAAFNEAPSLADRVASGDLPPVEERVPANPQVVTPVSDVGTYGGTMRQGIVGTSVTWGGGLYTVQWENLVQWKPDFSDVEPSIAERIEVSEDAREYTFYFRDGMKWSDGEPFGAEDILFYINDVVLNPDLNPGGGADWLPEPQRDGFSAELVGENAVKLTFPQPYGTLLYQLATWGGRQFAQYPKHYLQQFHLTYNEDVEALAAEAGLDGWVQLFYQKGPDNWGNPDRFMDVPEYPSLGPWIVESPIGAGTTATFVRNPFYWKVDTEGNQLPYIDEVVVTAYQDPQTRTLAMLNGDLDFIKDPGEENREVYFDAVDEGRPISIVPVVPDGGNTISIHFNQTANDPVLREIFSNKDFRVAMSYAINREEIIEVVFKGQGQPAQVSPLEGSPLYNERLATQYLEYDVDQANALLDGILPDKDAEGFRLRSDGERLSIIWTVLDQNYTGGDAKAWAQAAELMVGYFAEVGVEVKIDTVSDQVLTERRKTNAVDMFIFHGGEGGAGMSAIIDPRWHVPGEFWGMFGLGWYLGLVVNDASPEAEIAAAVPEDQFPEVVVQMREDFQAATQQATVEGQIEAMQVVLNESADNFWTIGVSRPGLSFQPLSTRLMNFPENAISGWLPGTHKLTRPEQWFLSE
jgi:peptide/nickel transport system substrate-binding protein